MIPKIIHQLWIGPKPAPTKLMNTWKEKHPEYEYIYWNEEEFIKRNFKSCLQNRVDEMTEINGKADILRWEILYEYGGIFLDADSICIEPFDDLIEKYNAFAGYENEIVRCAGWAKGNKEYNDVLANTHPLIATGTMAFPKNHELPKLAIEWIKNNCIDINKINKRAWRTVGPGLLTRLYFSKKWDDITILPSYYFLPIHACGLEYKGHGKVYAYQEWGSTKNSYDIMNNVKLPEQFIKPHTNNTVSILVSSYNTKAKYISDCLNSIKNQEGYYNIELVWINDGSDKLNTMILKKMLDGFLQTSRFTNLIYHDNIENMGIGFTLNKGINLCNHEIIIKMDSDDIMVKDRIIKQYEFMLNNEFIKICGSQVQMFDDNGKNRGVTNHPSLNWENYKQNPNHWFINHPSVCYRKSAVLEAGNYDPNLKQMCEDFELELRMLKTHGYIHNLPDVLLNYRLHDKQVTYNGGEGGRNKWNTIRNNIINTLINNNV
tara:strand:- start:1354 stop:2820 length:1467 start_codon:yes stop_codon:yes gene_type:complete